MVAAARASRRRRATTTRSTTWRTRWATVQRQPPVQRQPAQLLGRQPQRRDVDRAGLGLVDDGVRRHLPHRRPAAAQRSVLLAAQPAGDLDLHVVEPGGDQRGPDRVAAALRRRQRGPGRHVRPGLRADGHDPAAAASRSTRRRARPRAAAPRRSATRSRSRPGARTRCRSATRSRSPGSRPPATTARSPSRPCRRRARSSTRTRPPASPSRAAARSRSTRRARPRRATRSRSARRAAHGRSVGDVVTISGVGVGGYNGTFTITAVPSRGTFQYTARRPASPNSGGGTATYFSPFKVRIGGNDSAVDRRQRARRTRTRT